MSFMSQSLKAFTLTIFLNLLVWQGAAGCFLYVEPPPSILSQTNVAKEMRGAGGRREAWNVILSLSSAQTTGDKEKRSFETQFRENCGQCFELPLSYSLHFDIQFAFPSLPLYLLIGKKSRHPYGDLWRFRMSEVKYSKYICQTYRRHLLLKLQESERLGKISM